MSEDRRELARQLAAIGRCAYSESGERYSSKEAAMIAAIAAMIAAAFDREDPLD